MSFKKYYSIENHYQKGIIQKWMDRYLELNFMDFEITEKIHGSNFSILVDAKDISDIKIEFAKRTGVIKDNDEFFGYKCLFKQSPDYKSIIVNGLDYANMIDRLRTISMNKNKSVQLVGELFGKGIQKGVYYGEDKYFRWFDLLIDGEYISPKEADVLLKDIKHLKVPVIDIKKCEGDILTFISEIDTNIDSRFIDKKDNLIEGVVIKPYSEVLKHDDYYFVIKKKNDLFYEKKSKKKEESSKEYTDLLDKYMTVFNEYITQNRMDNLVSKHGEITFKDFKNFSYLYFRDVLEDYEKDVNDDTEYNYFNLDKKDKNIVNRELFNCINKFIRCYIVNKGSK